MNSHPVCNKCGGKGCELCHNGWECTGAECNKCEMGWELGGVPPSKVSTNVP